MSSPVILEKRKESRFSVFTSRYPRSPPSAPSRAPFTYSAASSTRKSCQTERKWEYLKTSVRYKIRRERERETLLLLMDHRLKPSPGSKAHNEHFELVWKVLHGTSWAAALLVSLLEKMDGQIPGEHRRTHFRVTFSPKQLPTSLSSSLFVVTSLLAPARWSIASWLELCN